MKVCPKLMRRWHGEFDQFNVIFWGGIALILALVLAVCFAGCADTRTTVSPGVVTTHDNQTRTPTHSLHLKITPTTMPALAPIGAPTITPPVGKELELPNGQTVPIPFGAAVELDYSDNASTTRTRDATSTGAGFTSDKDLTAQINSKPDMVKLEPVTDGGEAGGGSSASDGGSVIGWKPFINAVSAASTTAKWMMALGGLFLILGWAGCAIYSWMTSTIQWLSIAIVTAVGVAIIGTAVILDSHPMFFILAVIAGGVAIVWHFYHKVNTATADPTTPTSPTTTPPSSLITTAEADAKAAVAKVEGLIAGMFSAKPTTPTAAEIAVAKVAQTVNGPSA